MECSLALCFKDFAMVAIDKTNARSIMVMKDDYDKSFQLSDKMIMSVVGESGDTTQYAEFIAKNIQLYKMQHGYELSPKACANFTRRNLADYLRSRTPFTVNLLMTGYDEESEECELYTLDYLASMVKAPFAAHGYGGFFTTAIMDRDYRKDMNEKEAYDLMRSCVKEVQKRLIINLPNFQVQTISKEGIKNLEDITVKNLD
eukprot:05313.XXX_233259_232339_1 [CDS] Oithona nana genome sequencing.